MTRFSPHRVGRRPACWLFVTLVFAAACGPASQSGSTLDTAQAPPAAADRLLLASAKVALPPPGVSPLELPDPLSSGAKHLQSYCTACHALPTPSLHSTTDWPGVVRRMWLRMDYLSSEIAVPVPTTAERYVILQYLLDHAFKVTAAALPAGPGRDLFASRCSRCHDLPDPKQHAPEDWVAVVVRMSRHSQDMLGETVPRDDVQRIILYLENASRRRS